jgi:ribose-phosphate pyrophosphokinase
MAPSSWWPAVRRFADMEVFVEIQENVRGSDVFVMQSTSFPANDHLMELLIITDALRRASARRITAVIPYFGYARQDRKVGSRTPISAKLVANLITHAGADRVMTLDLHAAQIQGFFDIPTDNLFAAPVMVRDIKERSISAKSWWCRPTSAAWCAPAARQAHQCAARHHRQAPRTRRRVRSDERDRRRCGLHLHPDRRHRRFRRHAGERRRRAARQRRQGCLRLHHPRRSLRRRGRPHHLLALKELVITDSIQPTEAVKKAANIRSLPIATLIGEAISRTAAEESVSSLFD